MSASKLIGLLALGLLCWGGTAVADDGGIEYQRPSHLTRYDIATRDELRLGYHLRPLVSGDLAAGWPVLEGVEDQLGEWSTQFLAAPRIANTITEAMPINGQPALRQIDSLVADCAEILHVEKPKVYVRNHPFTNAYVKRAGQANFLVLTSGLLDLYEDAPEELRFVVGHELGHLKCEHLKLRDAAYGLLTAVQSVNLAVVPDRYQAVPPTLGLGRFFTWSREAEISADRAGLLCCQDPQTAYNALQRLLSGLGAESSWIDPESPDFDAEAVIEQYRVWQNEPFVKFVMHIKRFSAQAPFIPERVAALKSWADAGLYRRILARSEPKSASGDQLVVFQKIEVSGLAPEGETVDPYVIVFGEDEQLFKTPAISSTRAATWREFALSHRCADGQPFFFEIWDANTFDDTLLGGFAIYPANPEHDQKRGRTRYTTSIVWDWEQRSSRTRDGVANVEVEFRKRAK